MDVDTYNRQTIPGDLSATDYKMYINKFYGKATDLEKGKRIYYFYLFVILTKHTETTRLHFVGQTISV